MKKYRAFTLVELLSVIIILAVIIVIAIPKISNAIVSRKKQSFIASAKNVSRQLSYENLDKKEFSMAKLEDLGLQLGNDYDKEQSIAYIKDNEIYLDLVGKGKFEGMYLCGIYHHSSGIEVQSVPCNENPDLDVKLTVNLNGGKTTQTFTMMYKSGTEITLINPTRDEYNFDTWVLVSGNSVLEDNKLTIGTTNTILYALWKGDPLLTLNLNGGEIPYDLEPKYPTGTEVTLPNATKTNYDFIGWTVESGDALISGSRLTMGYEDTLIRANFSGEEYTITYNLNGGVGTILPTVYNYDIVGTVNLSDVIPTKFGYTFMGWAENSNATVPLYQAGEAYSKNNIGNKTLYAVWQIRSISCTSGNYLPLNSVNCATCEAGSICSGGTYTFNPTTTQGKIECVTGSYSTSGSSSCIACQGKTTTGNGQGSCNANCSNSVGVSTWETATWNSSTNTVSNNCVVKTCGSDYIKDGNTCILNTVTVLVHGYPNKTVKIDGTTYTLNNNGTVSVALTVGSHTFIDGYITSNTKTLTVTSSTTELAVGKKLTNNTSTALPTGSYSKVKVVGSVKVEQRKQSCNSCCWAEPVPTGTATITASISGAVSKTLGSATASLGYSSGASVCPENRNSSATLSTTATITTITGGTVKVSYSTSSSQGSGNAYVITSVGSASLSEIYIY